MEYIVFLSLGPEPSFFKSKTVVMRLYYRHYADEGFFHTLKMPSTRLFNNLVITIKTPEEAKGTDFSYVTAIISGPSWLAKLEAYLPCDLEVAGCGKLSFL